MSPENNTPLMNLDPGVAAFLQALAAQGGQPLYTLVPTDARNILLNVQRSIAVTPPPADIQDRIISGGPTGQIPLRIVRPQGISSPLPVVIYLHGGGWVLGDTTTHDRLIRELANGAQAAIVFVDYARSPEARYPVALEQIYAAARWIADHGASLNLDPSHLALAGDSVGGNMASACAILAKIRGGPRIDFQALFYPVTDITSFDTPSYRQFGTGEYWLARKGMEWFADSYAPDAATRTEPTASPLRATREHLQGLPPALLITGECDVLRDEGEAYAHKLMTAGVHVTAARYLGTIHDFVMLNPITHTPAPRAAIAQASAALRHALTRPSPAAV
ncbi:MAG TPA: alpha/beta hydrolase [Ktedonobacterales bacterium]|jgi:acetyl esterase